MGRPKLSEPRNEQLNLSLTSAELVNIKRRAAALGMRPVHFSRALLLDEGHKPSLTRASDRENNTSRLLRNALARVGNNLNQLLRHLHRTGEPLPADLEPLLNDIRRIVARVPL